MKKISFWRVFLVVVMVILTSIYVVKLKKKAPPVEKPIEKPVEVPPVIEEEKPQVKWRAAKKGFKALPGWEEADLRPSLKTFKVSCRVFLRQPQDKKVGSDNISLTAGDWKPVCQAALKLPDDAANQDIKAFFESWFTPGRFVEKRKPVQGLFTGYYVPIFEGSLNKTESFNIPIYGLPKNLVTLRLSDFDEKLPNRKLVGRVEGHNVYPFHTRAEINKGAIDKSAPKIVWLTNQVDRLFLEIQGSGVIQLPDKKQIFIGYAGQNGAAYTSIASILIKRGVMTWDNASMQNIRAYFNEHPEKMQEVLDQNKSFVFFDKQNRPEAKGAQGVYLTAGYSLAVDRAWVPLGMPLWLKTTYPNPTVENQAPLNRLFIAQDTGGAIKGPVRGDVFWGEGDKAGEIAGRMKNPGTYWLLMPRDTAAKDASIDSKTE